MRYALVVLLGMLCWVSPAAAQVSIGIGLPGVSIGINTGSYPELAPVPNYPVYYAPRGDVNLFFYDGMYWAYQRDSWYASSWYNGPWGLVSPEAVPEYVLRVPVRYYRRPPAAWAGWQRDAAPRWGERWGQEWAQHRKGWDQSDPHATQARAPLPVYQRQYSGNRYPQQQQQQQALLRDKYRYQPKEPIVREHYQQHGALPQPERRQQPNQRSSAPPPQSARPVSHSPPAQREGENVQRPAPAPPREGVPAVQRQQPQPAVQRQQPQPVAQHEQQAPKSQGQQDRPQGKGQDRGDTRQPEQGQEQERGQGRNK